MTTEELERPVVDPGLTESNITSSDTSTGSEAKDGGTLESDDLPDNTSHEENNTDQPETGGDDDEKEGKGGFLGIRLGK